MVLVLIGKRKVKTAHALSISENRTKVDQGKLDSEIHYMINLIITQSVCIVQLGYETL